MLFPQLLASYFYSTEDRMYHWNQSMGITLGFISHCAEEVTARLFADSHVAGDLQGMFVFMHFPSMVPYSPSRNSACSIYSIITRINETRG